MSHHHQVTNSCSNRAHTLATPYTALASRSSQNLQQIPIDSFLLSRQVIAPRCSGQRYYSVRHRTWSNMHSPPRSRFYRCHLRIRRPGFHCGTLHLPVQDVVRFWMVLSIYQIRSSAHAASFFILSYQAPFPFGVCSCGKRVGLGLGCKP